AASPEPVASATRPSDELQYAALQPDQKAISAEPTVETGISDAPAKPISTEKPPPPEIHPTPALSETIRLADSGVDESVLLAYVTNAAGTFSLGPEEIIYLNDIGVPA